MSAFFRTPRLRRALVTAKVLLTIAVPGFWISPGVAQSPENTGQPSEMPTATPDSTPAPLLPVTLEELAKNRAMWPREVALTRGVTLPLTADGKKVGEVQQNAGTILQVSSIDAASVSVVFNDRIAQIPPEATDVLERAEKQRPPPTPVPKPGLIGDRPATAPTPEPVSGKYLPLAREVMANIQARYWDENAALYHPKPGSHDHAAMWDNGVMFSAVVAAARNDPSDYRRLMDRYFKAMDAYWDRRARIPGYEPLKTAGNGNDKYYDDNAWMVITFTEAYALTKDAKYRKRAEEALEFTLSGWDDVLGGGIWWHETHKGHGKNTCSNAPSAVGCLVLAPYESLGKSAELTKKAADIVTWTNKTLRGDNGLFGDNINAETKKVNGGQLTYNSGLMLRANLGLYRRTGNPAYLHEAEKIGRAAEAFVQPDTQAFRDQPRFSHLMIEADLELYRTTRDPQLLRRSQLNADALYERWKTNPPEELLDIAAIARTLWLMADLETEAGRSFHEKVERRER